MERIKSHKRKRISRIQNITIIQLNKSKIKEVALECYQEVQLYQNIKHIPTELLKIYHDLIFYILKFVLGFLCMIFLITTFYIIGHGFNYANVISSLVSFSISIICFVFTILCHKTGKAIEKETDKNYIVSYFSAMVSFVALIIALISLLQ